MGKYQAPKSGGKGGTIIVLLIIISSIASGYVYLGGMGGETPDETDFEDSVNMLVVYNDTQHITPTHKKIQYTDRVRVLDADNTTLTPGVDYRFNPDTGGVKFLKSSNTTPGELVTVRYSVKQKQPATSASGMFPAWAMPLGIIVFALVALVGFAIHKSKKKRSRY